eukprot:GHVR01080612.1.p1 GENE.GHVR01080612.1~~GHVR01080612.1.p1  ORF type:complete len:122 (+),score=10.71 GHVR01080612.1:3742-4107(+)
MKGQYSKITIGDLLPTYDFHKRFYQLRRELADNKLNLDISLQKLIEPSNIYYGIKTHDDVLYVTHDYYSHVTSKTKMMQLTADYLQAAKKSHAYFATPVEYDHYGFSHPEQNYSLAQTTTK